VCACTCGGSQRDQVAREAQAFSCRSRIASYVVVHHMGGDELGVQVDCAQVGPRIKRWCTDKLGNRKEYSQAISPGTFDKVTSPVV
jgi:hypothetical protein